MTLDRQRLRILRQAAIRGVFRHYKELGLTWIDETPTVVPITGSCENVSTLYQLGEGQYLTQTAQLFLEVELQYNAGVCAFIRSFRADRSDRRHLNEFGLIEAEFAWPDEAAGTSSSRPAAGLEILLAGITAAVAAMLVGALTQRETIRALGGDVPRIEYAVELARAEKRTWPTLSYRDAIDLLNDIGQFGHLEFGADLGPEHETALLELMSKDYEYPTPVFITRYPERIKFFNMKIDPEDRDVVLSADLLLPTAGESVGAAVREDHYPTLETRLTGSSMFAQLNEAGQHTIHDFEPYLDLISSGHVPPHAGYGIGLERVLQFILAAPDIRSVSAPRQLLSELQPSIRA